MKRDDINVSTYGLRLHVQVERCSGKGRLDLLLLGDGEAVLQEHKRITMIKKDKIVVMVIHNAYSSLRRPKTDSGQRVSCTVTRSSYNTKLREFGMAFLGPY